MLLARGIHQPKHHQHQEAAGDGRRPTECAEPTVGLVGLCGTRRSRPNLDPNFSAKIVRIGLSGPKIFLACGALRGASPRGWCSPTRNRLPMTSPSSPSARQWEPQPRAPDTRLTVASGLPRGATAGPRADHTICGVPRPVGRPGRLTVSQQESSRHITRDPL